MTSTLLPLLLASTLILARAATEQPPSLAPVTVATARSSGTVSEATEQPPSPIPTVAVAQTFGPVSPSSSTPFEFGLSCRAILQSFGSFCDYVIEYTECFSQETIQRCKKIKRECRFRHSDGSRRLSICQSSLAYSCSYLDRAFTDKIVIEYCDVLLTLCTGGFAIPTSTLPYYYSDSSSDSSGAGIGIPTRSPIYDGYGSSSSGPRTGDSLTHSLPAGTAVPTSGYDEYGSSSSGPRTEDSLTHSLPAGTAVPTSGYGGYGSSSSGPRTGDSLTHSRPAGTAVPTSGYDGYGSGSGLSGSGSSSGSFSGFRCFGINSGSGSISGFGSSSGSGSSGITDGSGRPDGESGSGRPDGKSRSGRPDGGSGSGRPDGGSGSGRPDGKSRSGRPDGNSRSGRPDGESGSGRPDGESRSGRPDGNSRSGRPDSKSGSGRSGNDSDSRKPDGDGGITPENDTLSTTTEPTVTTLMPIINMLVNVEDLTSQQKENIVNIILTGLKEEQFLRTSVTFFREEIFRLVNMYLSHKGNNRQKRQQSSLSPNDVVIVEPLVEVEGGLQVAFVVGGGEGQSAPISGNDVMSVLEAQGQQLAEGLSNETGLLVGFSGVFQNVLTTSTAESPSTTTSEPSDATTNTPFLANNNFQGPKQQLSIGAIIGIVVGCLFTVILIPAVLIIFGVLTCRSLQRRKKSESFSSIMAKNYISEPSEGESTSNGTWQPMSERNEYVSVPSSDKNEGVYSV